MKRIDMHMPPFTGAFWFPNNVPMKSTQFFRSTDIVLEQGIILGTIWVRDLWNNHYHVPHNHSVGIIGIIDLIQL